MKKDERGVITLEACITVFAFLILMLLLSSLFVMFMAQNAMAHAKLQTAESLSLDVYRTETIGLLDGKISPIGSYVSQFVFGWFGKPEDNPNFITDDCWYTDQDKVAHRNRQIKNGFEEEPEEYQTDELTQTVKTRFLGYLCGGDEKEADEMLLRLNVKDGLSGLDFSGSYIKDDVLYVVVKYELESDFKIWDLNDIPVEQTANSKLWK